MSTKQLQQIVDSIKLKLQRGNTVYHTLLTNEKGYDDVMNYVNTFDANNTNYVDTVVLLDVCAKLGMSDYFKILFENRTEEITNNFNTCSAIFYAVYARNKEIVDTICEANLNNTIIKFALSSSLFACIKNDDNVLLDSLLKKYTFININITVEYMVEMCELDKRTHETTYNNDYHMLKDIYTFFKETHSDIVQKVIKHLNVDTETIIEPEIVTTNG